MLLHFIFVIKDKELGLRELEFEYIKKMAQFFKIWIKKTCIIRTDETRKIIQRLGAYKNWKIICNASTKNYLGQNY